MVLKKDILERVGVRIPPEVKEWYVNESIGLGLSMGQYMAYVLVNHQRNQEAQQAIKTLSELSKNQEVMDTNKEILSLMKSPEFQEAMKEYQTEIATDKQQKRLKP